MGQSWDNHGTIMGQSGDNHGTIMLLYFSLVPGFRGQGLRLVCVHALFPDTHPAVCPLQYGTAMCVCKIYSAFPYCNRRKLGGAKGENNSPYLLGVHHSALVNVQGSHLQHGVVGRAEGIWELVLSQLLSCVLNHTLAASLSIQVPFDLQQIVKPFNKYSYEEQGCNLHCQPLALYHTWPCAGFGSLAVWEREEGRGEEEEGGREGVRGEGRRREGEREEEGRGRGRMEGEREESRRETSKLVDAHLSEQWGTYKRGLPTSTQIGLQ